MRIIHLLLLCLLSSLLCPPPLFALTELPDIPSAVEAQLYQGTTEEIAAFIDKRQTLIDGLITLITTDIQKVKEEKDKLGLDAILDLFQGLSFQLKNLQAEVARAEPQALQNPPLGSPPYSLALFDDMVAFQQKAMLQLKQYEDTLAFGVARTTVLKDELTDLLLQYNEVRGDEGSRITAYEQVAYILSLQHEYALLQLKKPKIDKVLADTRLVAKEVEGLVEQVFAKLQINKNEIAELKKRLAVLQEQHLSSLAKLSAENLELNKQSVVVESKLDKATTAMASTAKEGHGADNAENEKDRLALMLEAIKFRQKSIIQEKTNNGLALDGLTFRLEWLTLTLEMSRGGKASDFVEKWWTKDEELIAQRESLVQELSLITQERSDLTARLAALSNRIEQSGLADTQAAVNKQAEKTTKELDAFILGMSNNINTLSLFQKEVETILQLLRSKMDQRERFLVWSGAYLSNKWEGVKGVLFYPLFSIGDTSVTLTTLFKILVMVLIGIWLLKVMRRKTANVLAEKTAMAPGAIHSLTTLIYYASLVLGGFFILATAGFNVSQLGIIFGALGVGIGFGLQTIFNNFFSGIILLTEQTIQVGDYVQLVTGVDGEVRQISIRATIVRTFDGEDIIVPNSEFVSSRVNTWSYGDNWRRLKIPFGVSYGSDPALVVRLAEEAAREVTVTKEDNAHPLRVFFEGFGNNSLDFSIRPWCWMNQIHAHTGMISDYYFALFRKFKEAGIEIPFPQTDLHIKSISPEVVAVLQEMAAPSGQLRTDEMNEKEARLMKSKGFPLCKRESEVL
jgi:small-conductance mechanosensitive channel